MHEGKLEDWDKFIDYRVKIDREKVKFVLKSRKCLYSFFRETVTGFVCKPNTLTDSGTLRVGVNWQLKGFTWACFGQKTTQIHI